MGCKSKTVVLNMAALMALVLLPVSMNVGASHGNAKVVKDYMNNIKEPGGAGASKGPDEYHAEEGARPKKDEEDGAPPADKGVPSKGVPIKRGGQEQHRPGGAAGGHDDEGAADVPHGRMPAAGGAVPGGARHKKEAGPGARAPAAPKGKHVRDTTIKKSGPSPRGPGHETKLPGDKQQHRVGPVAPKGKKDHDSDDTPINTSRP